MDFFWTYTSTIMLMVVGFLLIFMILLQRGRGGGLAGAFGGLGGQSAFGTKAGDVFTKITIVLAVIWVALAGLSGWAMRVESSQRFEGGSESSSVQSIDADNNENENNPFNDPGANQETVPLNNSEQDNNDTNDQPTSGESTQESDNEADKNR